MRNKAQINKEYIVKNKCSLKTHQKPFLCPILMGMQSKWFKTRKKNKNDNQIKSEKDMMPTARGVPKRSPI